MRNLKNAKITDWENYVQRSIQTGEHIDKGDTWYIPLPAISRKIPNAVSKYLIFLHTAECQNNPRSM